jgi:hypothetical protein
MTDTTKHTCNPAQPGKPMAFGKRAKPGACPRCDELRAGAEPRTLAWVDQKNSAAAADKARTAENRAHFAADGPHARGACGPVCTFGEW